MFKDRGKSFSYTPCVVILHCYYSTHDINVLYSMADKTGFRVCRCYCNHTANGE